MTDKQKLDREINPLISQGLLKKILEVEGLTVCRLANTGYVAFMHGLVHKQSGNNIGFNLTGPELNVLMHNPNVDTFMQINYQAVQKGEKRGFTFTGPIIEKFKGLKRRVDSMPQNPYINFGVEAELIEIAKQALASSKSNRRPFGK